MLHALDPAPVLGVSLGNVSLLRLDLTGGAAPGNKSFKLSGYLAAARRRGVTRLVSFGGAWSNHLHALAAVGLQHGLDTVGIVRGEEGPADTAMLADARRWGMHIVHVSRAEYRRRHAVAYQHHISERFGPCLLIPEGGGGLLGARGCSAIAERIRNLAPDARRVVLPVGSGTTLAGLAGSLDASYELLGIAALKGALDLEDRVRDLLQRLSAYTICPLVHPARSSLRWLRPGRPGAARVPARLRACSRYRAGTSTRAR
ncbi:MAG: pyridoxal-phosphate dependent enzyme [Halioglobus sp.]